MLEITVCKRKTGFKSWSVEFPQRIVLLQAGLSVAAPGDNIQAEALLTGGVPMLNVDLNEEAGWRARKLVLQNQSVGLTPLR